MASRKSKATVQQTITRIEQLRERTAGARSDRRHSLPIYNAFEFDLIQQALELFTNTLKAGLALEQSNER